MHCFDKLKLDFDGTIIWYLNDTQSIFSVFTFAWLQCSCLFSLFAFSSLITLSSEVLLLTETILISGVPAIVAAGTVAVVTRGLFMGKANWQCLSWGQFTGLIYRAAMGDIVPAAAALQQWVPKATCGSSLLCRDPGVGRSSLAHWCNSPSPPPFPNCVQSLRHSF